MEDRTTDPEKVAPSWGSIVLGQRAAPEDRRQRVCLDDWWQETAAMVDAGYTAFWKRPHRECGEWRILPEPTVSPDMLHYDAEDDIEPLERGEL